ncbi:glycoside hydrolase family 19 protein [Roseomonas sp. CCTCC AB2023176]|uniref:glycoside hydrolase family 19 protein n=1 Tax=Roseomonas sp. CCTCC AB2023176 TaxID=3342640 RepID=UPI0035DAD00F
MPWPTRTPTLGGLMSPLGPADPITSLLDRSRFQAADVMCRVDPKRSPFDLTSPVSGAPATGLKHIEVTQKELLLLVGRKEVKDAKQQAIFDAIINAASAALWFNKISTDPLQLCHFLGQCCHETGGFTALKEDTFYTEKNVRAAHKNLTEDQIARYSSCTAAEVREKIAELDKKIAKATIAKADTTEMQKAKEALQAKLKGLAAENRKAQEAYFNFKYGPTGPALGNTLPGDGWKFIGRGFIHLTGRENYEKFAKWMKEQSPGADTPPVVEQPDLLDTDATVGLRAGLFFWLTKKCDVKATKDDSEAVSKIVNRYDAKTFPKRAALTKKAKEIWGEKKPT